MCLLFSYQQFRINKVTCYRARLIMKARPPLREERSLGRQSRGAASANASRDRNLRNTCRGSHPWNQPRLCLRRRLKRQFILHLFAPCDVVASCIRAYLKRSNQLGVPAGTPCQPATRHQGSLHCRRSVDSATWHGQSLNSMPWHLLLPCQTFARCSETVDSASSSSNIWSHLFTLSNTWAMTTDVCGYEDKWRKRTRLLVEWIDSRDLHRFEKTSLQNKRWQ